MTSATELVHCSPSARPSRGFTLLELLVVIGIIGLLIGILAPAASRVLRSANATRVRADLNSIATALDQYKNDFGSYPQVIGIKAEDGTQVIGSGAHVLCQALFGLGPAYPVSATNFGGADGADGAGFRVRRAIDDWATASAPPAYQQSAAVKPWTMTLVTAARGDGIPDSFGGKVYGPYLKPENFRFDTDPALSAFDRIRVLDHTNSPILYYSASTPNVNMAAANSPVLAWAHDPTIATTSTPLKTALVAAANYRPLFNVNDNLHEQGTPANTQLNRDQLLVLLGDYNTNQIINGIEPPATSPPYLLVTRGYDGRWGPQGVVAGDAVVNQPAAQKCDDITNLK